MTKAPPPALLIGVTAQCRGQAAPWVAEERLYAWGVKLRASGGHRGAGAWRKAPSHCHFGDWDQNDFHGRKNGAENEIQPDGRRLQQSRGSIMAGRVT